MANRESVFQDIAVERLAQNAKWGEQNHSLPWWLVILQEELGELAETLLKGLGDSRVREELVQVAAVAVAMVESFDRCGAAGRSKR